MAQTVIGFFDTASEAQKAVDQLVSNGFSRNSIDLSTARDSDSVPTTDGTTTTTYDDTQTNSEEHESGISRFFSSLFGSDDDETTHHRAKAYGEVASQSDAIVTVHATSEDEASRAANLLDEAGAFDIDERASQYGLTDSQTPGAYPTAGTYDKTSTPVGTTYPADTIDDTDANSTIKVIQEDLQVGKRTVETGGVRVRSRIVEKPVEESLRLREERVRIQRNPVNRVATDADLSAFKQGEISVTEHAEVPVVNKEARVVEEISVGKDVNERTETIRDTVRNTEVDVEDTTDANRVTRTDSYPSEKLDSEKV